MKLLIDVPDTIAPGKFSRLSTTDRTELMNAFEKAEPIIEGNIVTYEPVEWAVQLSCKTVKLYAAAVEDK